MTQTVSQWRRWIYNHIPEWVRKHNFEIFAAILCMSAGIPLLVTNEVDAASLDATLHPALVRAWAAILALAPIAILLGLWFRRRLPMHQATTWMRVESWGLRALAYAAYIYAVAIITVNGLSVLPAEAIILIFALTCHTEAAGVIIKVEDYLRALGTDHAKP